MPNQTLLGEWEPILPVESRQLAEQLYNRAKELRLRNPEAIVYPQQENIFRALHLTPPANVKVVIVGQDPYINPGQADGLAFSCTRTPLPPSLRNIYKELVADIGCHMPSSGDLTPWAERGILLLNTTLTVLAGKSNSHANWGWKDFTHDIIRAALSLPQPIVFVLWGGNARSFVSDLEIASLGNQKKACICSSHPSPLGARKASIDVPAFIGSKPFSKVNSLLMEMGGEPIDWVLP